MEDDDTSLSTLFLVRRFYILFLIAETQFSVGSGHTKENPQTNFATQLSSWSAFTKWENLFPQQMVYVKCVKECKTHISFKRNSNIART